MTETFSDLEGDICDLDEMSDVATHYVEEIITSLLSSQRRHENLPITQHEGRLVLFCIYQLDKMTTSLRERFFNLLEGPPS